MGTDAIEQLTFRGQRLPSEVLRPQIVRAFDSWLEGTSEINAQLIDGVIPNPVKVHEDLRRMRRFLKLCDLADKLDAKKRPNPWSRSLEFKLPI